MFLHDHLKRNDRERSRIRTKIGGYNIDCHIVVLPRRLRRPNARKRTSGDAFTREFTTPLWRPAGDMAGASAINTLILSLSIGCVDSAAKA